MYHHMPQTPSNEAVLVDMITGNALLEFDPFELNVDHDGLADAFDDMLVQAVMAAQTYAEMYSDATVVLVWSGGDKAVRALCPVCDDVFCVGDGAPIILQNVSVVCCGDRECMEVDDE
jgi:hypothetical protein